MTGINNLIIAGVDEAGRGPLAGPVVAAAVILSKRIRGLTDSKLLSASKRDELFIKITSGCVAWAIGRADSEEIDTLNIHNATLLAMQRAITQLGVAPHEVWIDGLHCPHVFYKTKAIVQGDLTVPAISAASILAKVTRDQEMVVLDQQYPGYGFAQHKGYGTKLHLEQLKKLGPSPIHRQSFAPVREAGAGSIM